MQLHGESSLVLVSLHLLQVTFQLILRFNDYFVDSMCIHTTYILHYIKVWSARIKFSEYPMILIKGKPSFPVAAAKPWNSFSICQIFPISQDDKNPTVCFGKCLAVRGVVSECTVMQWSLFNILPCELFYFIRLSICIFFFLFLNSLGYKLDCIHF